MKKVNFIILALSISFALHLVGLFSFSLRIEGESSPLIYSWANIISKKDLSLGKREMVFPAGVDFSTSDVRKEYFSQPFLAKLYFSQGKDNSSPKASLAKVSPSLYSEEAGQKDNYVFLWEKAESFTSSEEAVVPYKVFVSSHGKVLFMYPEKLSANSDEDLYLQEYIRKSSFFLNDKFFWTKLEGVVK